MEPYTPLFCNRENAWVNHSNTNFLKDNVSNCVQLQHKRLCFRVLFCSRETLVWHKLWTLTKTWSGCRYTGKCYQLHFTGSARCQSQLLYLDCDHYNPKCTCESCGASSELQHEWQIVIRNPRTQLPEAPQIFSSWSRAGAWLCWPMRSSMQQYEPGCWERDQDE